MSPCSLALVFFSLFFDRVGGGGGVKRGCVNADESLTNSIQSLCLVYGGFAGF